MYGPGASVNDKNGFFSFKLFYGTMIRLIHFTLNKNKSQYFYRPFDKEGRLW
jgi:hypothetical protein